MISGFILPPDLRACIEAEARSAYPMECCGLIEGWHEGARAVATAVHPVRNMAGEIDRFEIAPADQFRLQREARARSRRVIGCYHSHPHGCAAPSIRDPANAGSEDFIWLIAALPAARMEIAAFALEHGRFRTLAVTESALA